MKPVFETSLYTNAAIRGCKSKNLDHVHSSLWSLHEVNKTEFDHQLVRLFERLPTAIAEDQTIWLSRESSFAQLAAYSESPSVWAALTAATKRAEVNLRLQLIDHAARGRLTPSSRKEFHKYLLAFFGDTSRSEPGGPKRGLLEREAYEDHGFLHSRRVQDLAAAIAAQDMEVMGIPDESASRTVWDAFRAKIAGLIQVSLSKG